ncbi:hypothetical protein J40TS1_47250 [Paenibacillus montaniterrae]|uniref:Uncharacterized protein n=1 Tax=Paenibacillus montaniterrae TaxID=429341 RepID=A0A919YYG6_9BACL|nr:hypothetical protein [Paenibacillus montaniterrae]GIP19083.1 hypothetical protein J40TS1_47250 [Paenibacillus montaniterrae]
MISLLLFVIGCYVLAAVSVHLYYRMCQHQQAEKHYVLLADQPHEQMEWIMRSMHSFSKWMGIPVHVTIVPSVHCYELSFMADRWSSQWFPIQINQQASTPAHAIVVDLNKEQDLCKLPF